MARSNFTFSALDRAQTGGSDLLDSARGPTTNVFAKGNDLELCMNEKKALTLLEGLYQKCPQAGADIFARMKGLKSSAADSLRQKLLDNTGLCSDLGAANTALLDGIQGMDTGMAWQVRNAFLDRFSRTSTKDASKALRATGRSLRGLDSGEADAMRSKLISLNDEEALIGVAEGLSGLDTERAWAAREQIFTGLKSSIALQYAVGISCNGLESGRARSFAGKAGYGSLQYCLDKDDSSAAWQIRREIVDKGDSSQIRRVLAGIRDLDSETSWKFREYALALKGSGDSILYSCGNVKSAAADAFIRKVSALCESDAERATLIQGCFSKVAEELRRDLPDEEKIRSMKGVVKGAKAYELSRLCDAYLEKKGDPANVIAAIGFEGMTNTAVVGVLGKACRMMTPPAALGMLFEER